ncbi:MAG: hypothetical protein ACT4QC_01065 [Planctomycetaceae bacterium]
MSRRPSMNWISGIVGLWALAAGAVGLAEDSGGELTRQLQGAERVLIGTPENDVEAPGGEQFLVEINEVLRGTGRRGELARITNSGDKAKFPHFKAGQAYVFVLKKNQGGKGWVNLSTAEIPVEEDSVRLVVAGKTIETIRREQLDDLVAMTASQGEQTPLRETLAGNWLVLLSQRGVDFPIWLIEAQQAGSGAWQVKLLETSKQLAASTLKEFSIDGSDVRLVFAADGQTFDFQGRLQAGLVRGSIDVGGQSIEPARLAATDATDLKKGGEPTPSSGREDFIKANSPEPSSAALQQFVRRFPDSPLALDAYLEILGLVKGEESSDANLRKLVENFLRASKRWGPRIELQSLITAGRVLSARNLNSELALELLNSAEKRLGDSAPSFWKKLVRTDRGKLLLLSGNEPEGLALLNEARETDRFNPEIAWVLAQHAEKSGKTDQALALYAELASLPQLDMMLQQSIMQSGRKPSREDSAQAAVARLWKEKHGKADGLSEFLDQTYHAAISAVAGGRNPARTAGEGTRVVLCELFTGAMCPPCVGADVATAALEAAFDKSSVIVLRYHEHIPGPDPLANEDTEERLHEYGVQSTPSIFVNGRPFAGAGGSITQAPEIFGRLKETVAPYLEEKIELRIDLSAAAQAGKLAISAKAAGLKKFPDEVKLYLVLAEDMLEYPAGNGVRFHEMIVRSMPGGVEGIEPENGQLSFRGEIDLGQLKSQLRKYLSEKEAEFEDQFEQKPLDLKALHLVGFLQHEDTREVLQAAAVAVTGDLHAPEAPPAAKPAPTKAPQAGARKK